MLFISPVEIPYANDPSSALVRMADEEGYGYCFFDLGLTQEEQSIFDEIAIERSQDYNYFGTVSDLRDGIAIFLSEIGSNELEIAAKAAKSIQDTIDRIMVASGREVAWIYLRASIPHTAYDVPRWHFDGCYYPLQKENIQYRFAYPFIGAPTLFYPIPNRSKELRRIIWIHMGNRGFMDELCSPQDAMTAEKGQGVFFIAGDQKLAAVHSEPVASEKRLFFSIVPCNRNEIEALKGKVAHFYNVPPR